MSSDKAIHYGLRPAKNIERKMLLEQFRELVAIDELRNYRYIGFGSRYFSDFILFHRALAINDMYSIERNSAKKELFEFNKPFKCINMEFKESNQALPTIPWDKRCMVWLDYDGGFDQSVITDIDIACGNIKDGSLFVISVNVHPCSSEKLEPGEQDEYRYSELVNAIGPDYIPADVKGKDLSSWGLAKVVHRIFIDKVTNTVNARNGGLGEDNKLAFYPTVYFRYQDGAKMATFGGLILRKDQEHVLKAVKNSDFYRGGDDFFMIDVPNLTFKELRHLDKVLPVTQFSSQTLDAIKPISRAAAESYSKLYRYFPAFAETEV